MGSRVVTDTPQGGILPEGMRIWDVERGPEYLVMFTPEQAALQRRAFLVELAQWHREAAEKAEATLGRLDAESG